MKFRQASSFTSGVAYLPPTCTHNPTRHLGFAFHGQELSWDELSLHHLLISPPLRSHTISSRGWHARFEASFRLSDMQRCFQQMRPLLSFLPLRSMYKWIFCRATRSKFSLRAVRRRLVGSNYSIAFLSTLA